MKHLNVIIFLLSVSLAEPYNILFLESFPATSHFMMYERVVMELLGKYFVIKETVSLDRV
jgi:hypothetical protein